MEKASDPLAPGGRPPQSFSRIVANFAQRRRQVLRPRPRQAVAAAAARIEEPRRAVAARNVERPRDTRHDRRQSHRQRLVDGQAPALAARRQGEAVHGSVQGAQFAAR